MGGQSHWPSLAASPSSLWVVLSSFLPQGLSIHTPPPASCKSLPGSLASRPVVQLCRLLTAQRHLLREEQGAPEVSLSCQALCDVRCVYRVEEGLSASMGSKNHLFLIYTEVPGCRSAKTHQPCPSLVSHAVMVYSLSVALLDCKLSGQRE